MQYPSHINEAEIERLAMYYAVRSRYYLNWNILPYLSYIIIIIIYIEIYS